MTTPSDLAWGDCPAVEKDPLRLSDAWVFREDGVSLAVFVELFPGVPLEQARSVLEHAARSTAAAVA